MVQPVLFDRFAYCQFVDSFVLWIPLSCGAKTTGGYKVVSFVIAVLDRVCDCCTRSSFIFSDGIVTLCDVLKWCCIREASIFSGVFLFYSLEHM